MLHCIPWFGGGGAERQCALICQLLAERGTEVHLAYVLAGNESFLRELAAAGVVLHDLGHGLPRNIWTAQKDPRVLWRMAVLVRRLRPDLVQSWNRPMDTVVGLVAKCLAIRWVLSERSSELLYRDRRELLRRFVARGSLAILANSQGGIAYWRQYANPRSLLAVLPNIILQEQMVGDPTTIAWPADLPRDRTLVYVGRLSKEKNIGQMLEAFAIAHRQSGAYGILCGSGPLLRYAKEQATRCGVRAVGMVERPWQWMKQAAGLLSVSLVEGHPNAVAEAMAVHCPLVVSDIPAHRAILDERSASFVPPDSTERIANGIAALLADPAGHHERADNAFAIAAQWRPDRMIEQYESFYDRVLHA